MENGRSEPLEVPITPPGSRVTLPKKSEESFESRSMRVIRLGLETLTVRATVLVMIAMIFWMTMMSLDDPKPLKIVLIAVFAVCATLFCRFGHKEN